MPPTEHARILCGLNVGTEIRIFGMMAVPYTPPTPALSIIVPIGHSLVDFEQTLISVLENRPADCEVLVAHDGSYDDPFELCDEVRFVIGPTNRTVELIHAATEASSAQIVHVLADGLSASPGWCDEAIGHFDAPTIGAVSPVIRNPGSDQLVAAGWTDSVTRRLIPSVRQKSDIGVYLPASFWRRELLRSLADAFTGREIEQATYAYHCLMLDAGWQIVLADEATVYCDQRLPWETSSFQRGQQLEWIANFFDPQPRTDSMRATVVSLLANSLRPAHWAESLGRAFAPLAAHTLGPLMHPQYVMEVDEDEAVLQMPRQEVIRRAA